MRKDRRAFFSSELWRTEINGYIRGTNILVSLPTCFSVVCPLSVSCFMYEKKPDILLNYFVEGGKTKGEEKYQQHLKCRDCMKRKTLCM
jgi:hypothetical protein